MNSHVLYIEDEEDFQMLVTTILTRAGLEVRLAGTAEEGFRHLDHERPGAILLDINLPDASGYDVCQRLRQDSRWADLPVLMLTVRRKPEEWIKGYSCGASDYISKPIEPQQLVDRIKHHLAGPPSGTPVSANAEFKLIRAVVAGNRAAYEVLVEKYHKRLVESFGPLITNDTHLEDVISQTFVIALGRLSEFRGESSFFTWLYRIAMNEFMAICRRPRTLPIEDILGDQEARINWPFQESLAHDEALTRREFSENVLNHFSHVPPIYKKTLELYCLEDMSYEAIARRLRIPEGTVMSRLHKGRKLLQDALAKKAIHP